MADYKELLRRAISALPENNGAARRAVYEKARSALVGQLRAIQPPLPARDITQHRLQLEDCIRQVEQEASEAVISLGRDGPLSPRPAPRPTPAPAPAPAAPKPAPEPVPAPSAAAEPTKAEPVASEPAEPARAQPPEAEAEAETAPEPVAEPEPEPSPVETRAEPVEEPVTQDTGAPLAAAAPTSIEDIITQAAATSGVTVDRVDSVAPETATPEAPAAAQTPAESPVAVSPPAEPKPARPSFFSPRPEPAVQAMGTGTGAASAASLAPRIEPILGSTALASQPVATEPVIIEPPLPVDTALSSVREVDVEQDDTREAEGAIERAIETLDREARGETTEPLPERSGTTQPEGELQDEDAGFAPAGAERRSGAGLTIFLIVFAILLAGVGGAGYWAWREGYVDLDQMFGRSQTPVTEPVTTTEPSAVPTMDNATPTTSSGEEGASGPGNTATTAATEPTSALEVTDDRLEPTPEPVTPTGTETVLPSIGNSEIKTEERLSGEDTSIAATEDPAASVDPADLAGNQSLLLEASANGQGGAVPFSGTVEWTEGTDEIGLPTLLGEASIPARNLGVSIIIRKNNDPVLPASHLMEISFDVPDTFVGGSIATLAGVLLKDQELVPGTALAGAAARVVGNSFLFALSASEGDLTANTDLLENRRWLDLAIVYGTGRNAILTLEKDDEAQALFEKVLAAWAQ
ncbi:hypothetical protein [Devosia salina]|uniref:Uncharacterized protein n=1 Tax=Devosia salina TaxID=2860336 RepID=A0ABX8WBZ2_9HYPH|nr:hypothetical protein [Devosia salina]QYO76212.1 hypothetical protein K1X15_16590 [Devosia salina]